MTVLSLMFNCLNEKQVENYDIMQDKPVQCFVGAHSTFDNLQLIPKEKLIKIKTLTKDDKYYIFEDLDEVIDDRLIDKIWNMILKRCEVYEDFCNKR